MGVVSRAKALPVCVSVGDSEAIVRVPLLGGVIVGGLPHHGLSVKTLDLTFARSVMSDIFALIPSLFKPDNPEISERITSIFPLMTNECKKLRNPLFNVFPQEMDPNMEENHHI